MDRSRQRIHAGGLERGKFVFSGISDFLIHIHPHSSQNQHQAEAARREREVPVGCVIVREGKVIARGHNLTNATRNVRMRKGS